MTNNNQETITVPGWLVGDTERETLKRELEAALKAVEDLAREISESIGFKCAVSAIFFGNNEDTNELTNAALELGWEARSYEGSHWAQSDVGADHNKIVIFRNSVPPHLEEDE